MFKQRFHILITHQNILKLVVEHAELTFASAIDVILFLVLTHTDFRLIDEVRKIPSIIGFGHAYGYIPITFQKIPTHTRHPTHTLAHRMVAADNHELIASDAVDSVVPEGRILVVVATCRCDCLLY